MDIEAEESNIEENIDLVALASAEDQDDNSGSDEIQLSDTEQKAYDQGWRPQADFEGPEDNWKSPKEYLRDGEFLATIKGLNQKIDTMGQDFDSRLDNVKKINDARRQKEISDLKSQQREAVVVSDTDAYDKAQGQIEELEKTPVDDKTVTNDRSVVDSWVAKNSWINNKGDEKADFAQDTWNGYVQRYPNSTDEEALAHVEAQVAKYHPTDNSNPRRNGQNNTETPAKRGKKGSRGLSMTDLTQDEKTEWSQFGSMFKDEKQFLKAVADTRAAS